MREVLFRGKTYEGEWVQGDLNHYHSGSGVFIAEREAKGDFCKRVDPETTGQYTGLTDKNGKKIFEGDIVVMNIKGDYTICKVAWADNVAQFQLWQKNTIPHTPTALNLGNYDCEIIGNIHDNPELLGGADNGKVC